MGGCFGCMSGISRRGRGGRGGWQAGGRHRRLQVQARPPAHEAACPRLTSVEGLVPGRPFTSTKPCLMEACKRARLAAGSLAERKASSRSLPCAGSKGWGGGSRAEAGEAAGRSGRLAHL